MSLWCAAVGILVFAQCVVYQHPWVCCFAAPAAVYMRPPVCMAAVVPHRHEVLAMRKALSVSRASASSCCGDLVAVVLCWCSPSPCSPTGTQGM